MNDDKLFNRRTERRDAAENRQRILDAALRLFKKNGVEQVSMNQIAKEAEIGSGTLYRRYRNKGELCLDLLKENVVIFFENAEAYLEDNRTASASERLKGVLSLYIRFRESKAQLLKGVEDSTVTNRSKPGTHSPLYDELHQLFVELFNEIEPGTDNVFRTDMLLQALRSDAYLFQREARGHTPEEILEQICALFIPIHGS
ncbi:TetR/AcrR family transcriptional regulator [Heyndrickxia ginsengihumi]|uniref:TetR/AcrR family transcriptional regulator n=1 Tax=Heyndrickxia ginsengihumi TaxID=363870 RepID=A0A6M0PB11_9BACI|nr:TetR/AcrR family transcriptional regulator [Heyndrickxia ginsengihumi]MCM3023945.1 TetR/AcrR family transcriptional regulator [Heyndrickxia ginsengihumi]NEY21633.1 TetR/AcrR family transcriptional regulator [Heyndrickxia ginsengihumi]